MAIETWNILNGEIQFTSNSFVVLTDRDALAQRLEGRIEMFVGEWFLDSTRGIDWTDILSSKPFRTENIDPIIRAALLADPAVTEILELTFTQDNTTRQLAIDFSVRSDVGLVDGGVLKS